MSAKVSQQEKMQAALLASAATALGSPFMPAAEAANVSPSLKNLLYSVFWGGAVLTAIAVAVSAVSSFDKLDSRK